jgi:hypothetical protein
VDQQLLLLLSDHRCFLLRLQKAAVQDHHVVAQMQLQEAAVQDHHVVAQIQLQKIFARYYRYLFHIIVFSKL